MPHRAADSRRQRPNTGGLFCHAGPQADPNPQALDREGVSRSVEAQGVLAVCIQHEMDHLVGKVFVEYLSSLKRNRIKTKMRKLAREGRD